jgi:opacity protein-like surface antigen
MCNSVRLAVLSSAIAAALLSGLYTPVHAADLSAIRPAAIQPLGVNWSGFYLGANIGGAFTSEDVTTPLGNGSTDPSGAVGGFQAGYNYMISPLWLVGVEAEFDLSSAEGTTNFINPAPALATTMTSDHHWYDTVTGRLGYVAGPWLLYVKGGGAWMNADYHFNFGGGGVASQSQVSSTRTGWTAGVGLEYMVMPGWSAKVAYDYLDFGTTTLTPAVPVVTGASVKTEVHEVKAGVNWHWSP